MNRCLITDLDGTFLGGSAGDRARLHAMFSDDVRTTRLVYCSGRSYAKIKRDIDAGVLPRPDAIIGDVGCGLWDADGRPMCERFEREVVARWAGSRERVLPVLADLSGLSLQPETGPWRCSYFYDELEIAEEASRRLTAMPVDTLISGGRYFDVLPPGVNKGFAVQHLMTLWGLLADDVLVAGDTLNDLAMLQLPVPAVAVGNADEQLCSRLNLNELTHLAERTGAGGILEAFTVFGWGR
jgi:hydroxymethylpyrimidine pyrophosphatase-like HAD family hydrolase